MTALSKPAMILGGLAVGCALVAWMWIGLYGGKIDTDAGSANRQLNEYHQLYPTAGQTLTDAKSRIEGNNAIQIKAQSDTEARLLCELPSEFMVVGVNEVNSRLKTVADDLRQKSTSRSCALPDLLLQGSKVAEDDAGQRLQLAEAFALKSILNVFIDAGLEKIDVVNRNTTRIDPTGSYIIFGLHIELETTQTQAVELLKILRQEHDHGLGLRDVTLRPTAPKRVAMILELTLMMRAAGSKQANLPVEPAAEALSGGSGSGLPTSTTPITVPANLAPASGSPGNRF